MKTTALSHLFENFRIFFFLN